MLAPVDCWFSRESNLDRSFCPHAFGAGLHIARLFSRSIDRARCVGAELLRYSARTMSDPSDQLRDADQPTRASERDLEDVTILLVEDDPRAAKWARLAMEDRGAQILWATRIDQARLLVERHQPELALLDVSLPDGNGLDLIVELRTQELPCACVVLTGNPESNVARIAAGLGVTEFLAKPVDLERLHVAVSQARERTRQLRRILAEYKGHVVQSEIDEGVGRRLAAAREQPSDKAVDANER